METICDEIISIKVSRLLTANLFRTNTVQATYANSVSIIVNRLLLLLLIGQFDILKQFSEIKRSYFRTKH